MGLFDSVRGLVSGDDEPTDDDTDAAVPGRRDPTPTTFRNKAADAVADWDAHELDYSLDSLSRLDDFADKQGAKLDVMHNEGDDAVANLHTRYTIQAGSYLGEVLARQRDGEWVEGDERWAVSLEYEGDPATVDVFEIAGHSFAEEPVFGEVADRFTADDDDPSDSGPAPVDTSDMAARAEELADFWNGYDLNFSPRSLARLDELADDEWDEDRFRDTELGGSDMDSGMYTELVKQLGSYYGEVLVRSLDAKWTRRDDDIAVAVDGATDAPPVPVPVFSVAANSLSGPSVFATRFNDITDRANLEVPAVATTAGVTPATGTPAATNREDEDLTAVKPDTATDSVDSGADTESTDDPSTAEPAADAETGTRPTSRGTVTGTAETSTEPTDDTDPLAASVVDGADDDATSPPTDETTDTTDGAEDDTTAESDPSPRADSRERTKAESGRPADTDAGGDTDTGPTVDPEGKSPLETAIEETVAAGLVDRADRDDDATPATTPTESGAEIDTAATTKAQSPGRDADAGDGDSETGTTNRRANEPELNDEAAKREALAAEISDSGPAESGPTLPTPDDLHDNAEAFAATYPGYDLDFSPDSLSRLDRLVTEEYDPATFGDFELDDPDSQFQLDRVTEVGGYFALVIEGTAGGEWERTDDGLQFVVEGANGVARLDPIGVAVGCVRDDDSFAATYAAIRDRLSA